MSYSEIRNSEIYHIYVYFITIWGDILIPTGITHIRIWFQMFTFQVLCAFLEFCWNHEKKILTFFIAGWKLGNGLHNNFQPTILGIIAPLFYKYIMILCVVCFLYLNIKHQLKPIIIQTLTNNIYSYLFLWKNIDLVNWYTNCFFNRTDSLVSNKF